MRLLAFLKIRKTEKTSGFTLAETVVVVFIMVILGSILLANARKPNWKFELARDIQTVLADARKAQNLATGAQEVTCGGNTKVPYYGFRTQTNSSGPTTYQVFVDCNRNNKYETGPGGDYFIDSVTLPNSFVAQTFPVSGGSKYLEAVYISPNPDLVVNKNPSITGYTIRICHVNDASLCRILDANQKGNIQLYGN